VTDITPAADGAVEVLVPQWGMGMSEATVVTWLIPEGGHVDAGADLVEIEAEKSEDVIKAPVGGVLETIVVGEGEAAAVRDVLARIRPAG
jgi:pyruvate/2-oxoglutarate dehydrogenase complex dihydrolipoamide acyltransferase (E2) component